MHAVPHLQACDLAAALVGCDEALCLVTQHDGSEEVRLRCHMGLHRAEAFVLKDPCRQGWAQELQRAVSKQSVLALHSGFCFSRPCAATRACGNAQSRVDWKRMSRSRTRMVRPMLRCSASLLGCDCAAA